PVGRLTRLEVLKANILELGIAGIIGTNKVRNLTEEQKLRLARQIELARDLSKPYGVRGLGQLQLGPQAVGMAHGLKVTASLQETRTYTMTCEGPAPPDKPLVLHKWADKQAAQVGDEITFFLKYSNQ